MPNTARTYTAEEEAEMRAAGLRPVTIWVPDLTNPAAAEAYRRHAKSLAEAPDVDIDSFLEAAWQELEDELTGQEK